MSLLSYSYSIAERRRTSERSGGVSQCLWGQHYGICSKHVVHSLEYCFTVCVTVYFHLLNWPRGFIFTVPYLHQVGIKMDLHYRDAIMSAMASQITSLTIVYSVVYSGADNRKHQSSSSLAFAQGIRRWPLNSPHKWPVTQKMFPFDDVIMLRTLFLFTRILSSPFCLHVYCAVLVYTYTVQYFCLHVHCAVLFVYTYTEQSLCINAGTHYDP